MSKRHDDALFIQHGACNPSGIAHALMSACKECLDEGVSQREDPAVRLIVHQLAYLCDTAEFDAMIGVQGDPYATAMNACRAKAKGVTP